jgi:hypothetical protein
MPDMNMMNQRPNPNDNEAAMARADLYKLANYSMKLFKMIQDGDQLEGWVQAKVTKAADYVASVYHYMEYEMKFSEYGDRLENADMYTESVKREYKRKLTEAKVKLAKLKEKNIADLDEGWEDMMKSVAANKDKTTGKFDKKSTSTGTQYTRKASTFTDGGDDSDTKKAKKKAKANEGIADIAKKAGSALKKAGSKALDKLGHGSDEDMIKDLQKKTGMPQTGKKPHAVQNEASRSEKFNPLKHVKNPTKGEKDAAKDVKRGSYADRAAMLRSAEADGRLKEASKPDFLDMDKDGDKKEPMKKAIKDKKVKEGWDDMMKAVAANKDKTTGKFDKKSTSTGTQYTRKASTFTDGGEDKDVKKAKKK